MTWSIYPEGDSRQIVRIERVLLAAAGSAFAVLVVLALAASGYLPMQEALIFTAMASACVIAGYAAIRSGFNLQWKDPNLTVPFMVSAALSISYMVYHGGEARPALFAIYIVAFMFGVLTLRLRRLIAVALFYWSCYLGVVLVQRWLHPESTDMHREGITLAVYFMVLGWFTGLGWYIDNLKGRLRTTSEKMASALSDLEKLARVDVLTGCYNRRHAMEVLAIECKRVERGTPLSICLLDIDHFKRINDSYGHHAGDEVLGAMARAVQPLLRATDLFARYGGEEFLLMLSQTRAREAVLVCERVRKAIADLQLPALPADRRISVSIGAAEHQAGSPVTKTLQRADTALYEAKGRGRNCVVCAE